MISTVKQALELDTANVTFADAYWARPEAIHHDPSNEFPQKSLPPHVAKNMVEDVLQIDMNARLNMAGWLTTHMEQEAVDIITSALHINAIDTVQYPSASKLAQRCVNFLGDLWHAPPGFKGTETIGSTEAIYIAILAMKKNWQAKRRHLGKDTHNPNLIFGHNAQIAWQKACSYFDIEPRFVELSEGHLVLDPQELPKLVDEHTIGVACMVGSTYNGQYEDVSAVNDVLDAIKSENTELDIPIHVDAAGGGLIAPMLTPNFKFDFQLPHVQSISFSGHKFGFVYPGVAFVLVRSQEWLPKDMEFSVDYLGSESSHWTMNFSRPGAFIIAQYYNFVRFGKEGYTKIFRNLMKIYEFLKAKLEESGHFEILSSGDMPVVAFRIKPELNKAYTEFDIMHRLKEHRFMVPAYKMAPKAQHITLMRVCIRLGFDFEMAEDLVEALHHVIDYLDKQQSEKGAVLKKDGGGEEGGDQQHGIC